MANQPKNKAQASYLIGQNRWLILSIAFLLILYLLLPILAPFLIAAILAYICDPIVDRLCLIKLGRFSFNRTLATLIVIAGLLIIVISLFLILIPLLQKQSALIIERLPLLVNTFHHNFEPWLQAQFGVSLEIDGAKIQQIIKENWQNTGNMLTNVLKIAGSKGLAFIGVIANIILLPIVLLYLLRDWDIIISRIGELVPRNQFSKTCMIAKEIDDVIAEFFRGQLSVMLCLCVFYSLGLWLAGLDMALSLGLIAGLLSFVPFLGFALAFTLALLLSALQFPSLAEFFPVLIVFGLGQIVESYVLTPNLVGDRIGLHPVVVILGLLAGGQLFGFAGILLALPVSAATAVGLKHLKNSYLNSNTYLSS